MYPEGPRRILLGFRSTIIVFLCSLLMDIHIIYRCLLYQIMLQTSLLSFISAGLLRTSEDHFYLSNENIRDFSTFFWTFPLNFISQILVVLSWDSFHSDIHFIHLEYLPFPTSILVIIWPGSPYLPRSASFWCLRNIFINSIIFLNSNLKICCMLGPSVGDRITKFPFWNPS